VGYDFCNLIEVAHRLFEQRKLALLPFGYALRAAGNEGLFAAQDASGKCERKAKILRQAVRDGDPAYRLDPAMAALVRFLFPDIAGKRDRD
jgi:hypothetical protein